MISFCWFCKFANKFPITRYDVIFLTKTCHTGYQHLMCGMQYLQAVGSCTPPPSSGRAKNTKILKDFWRERFIEPLTLPFPNGVTRNPRGSSNRKYGSQQKIWVPAENMGPSRKYGSQRKIWVPTENSSKTQRK